MRLICLGAIVLGAVACDEGGSTSAPTSVPAVDQAVPAEVTDLAATVATGDLASSPFPRMATVDVGPNGQLVFVPATVDIAAGGTVTWNWPTGKSMPHNVTSVDTPAAFAASPTQVHGSFDLTFAKAGRFGYFCTVHGRIMSGTVVVH